MLPAQDRPFKSHQPTEDRPFKAHQPTEDRPFGVQRIVNIISFTYMCRACAFTTLYTKSICFIWIRSDCFLPFWHFYQIGSNGHKLKRFILYSHFRFFCQLVSKHTSDPNSKRWIMIPIEYKIKNGIINQQGSPCAEWYPNVYFCNLVKKASVLYRKNGIFHYAHLNSPVAQRFYPLFFKIQCLSVISLTHLSKILRPSAL